MGRLAWIGWLVVLAGCSRDPGPREQVRGKVYYQGQPIPGGTIVFAPDPDRNGQGFPLARAAILGDGTFDFGTGPDQGAVAGWHRVTFLPADAVAGGLAFPLPGKYADPQQGGQTCEVKAGQTLYQIDPAPYRAAFDSAQASAAKSQARAAVQSRVTVLTWIFRTSAISSIVKPAK